MIRVAFYQFFPGGGIGRYTHELASALDRLPGVEVTVLCSDDFEYRSVAKYRVWEGLFRVAHARPLIRRFRFLAAQLINPLRCLRYANRQSVDVVHFSNINHLTYLWWRGLVRRLGVKVVATAHDVRRGKAILNRSWEERSLRWFYRDADALFVHSRDQQSDLIAFTGEELRSVHVVPHGLYAYPPAKRSREELKRAFKIPSGEMVGLFFGMLREDKNLHGLLEALALVPEEKRPMLIVAGKMLESGRLSLAELRLEVKRLGIDEFVRLDDRYVDEDEVGDLYRLADFACLTYLTSFTSQSGVLNVAAYFETPVIATPSPTMAETISNYRLGVLCKNHTPAAIAQGIETLLTDTKTKKTFGFGCYQEDHSWETNAETTLRVYRQIIGGSGEI